MVLQLLRLSTYIEGVARTVRALCKVSYTRYHPNASGNHPQAFGNTRQSGLRWASSLGKISTNIKKVPHYARTVQQHPHPPEALSTAQPP